jgi:hypothetical protein
MQRPQHTLQRGLTLGRCASRCAAAAAACHAKVAGELCGGTLELRQLCRHTRAARLCMRAERRSSGAPALCDRVLRHNHPKGGLNAGTAARLCACVCVPAHQSPPTALSQKVDNCPLVRRVCSQQQGATVESSRR